MRAQQRILQWIVPSFLALFLAVPASALAQRRGIVIHRPPVRIVNVGFYDPFWGWSSYPSRFGPYGYSQYPPPYGYAPLTGSIRLEATPKQAEVFVDGYRAGVVDDFDGVFQRLNLKAGEHDVALYLAGYRTITQHVYVNPGSEQRMRLTMVALEPGEAAEIRPQPASPPQSLSGDMMGGRSDMQVRGMAGTPMRAAEQPTTAPAKFGSLSLRVVPANADIWIDGRRWRNPNALAALVVQLSEGKHKIEVSQPNYERYVNEIEIKVGETQTVNVSLTRIK